MGVLTGFDGPINTSAILAKRISLQGIYVGPVLSLQAAIRVGVEPQIDRVYSFDEAEHAYDALARAQHFGKLVVKIQ